MNKNNQNEKYVPTLYNQAANINEQLSKIKVFNTNTLEIYTKNEETLELYSQGVFAYKNDKEFFTRINGVRKNMGVIHISKAIGTVLAEIDADAIQLIYLKDYTDRAYEKIKHFNTVKQICGDPDDEAEYSLNEDKRNQFIEGLTMFVAKQVFTYKLALNTIVNERIKGAVDRMVGIKDRTRTLHAATWQIANVLKDRGMSPNEVKRKVLELYSKTDEELRLMAKNNQWGYQQARIDKKVYEKKFGRLKNKKDKVDTTA